MSSIKKVKLSKVLADYHEFIIENRYNKEIHDGNLVASEFMSMDYDEQLIIKQWLDF